MNSHPEFSMNAIDSLIEKVRGYNPNVDADLIHNAFVFAFEAHKDQLRQSGEKYIIHPLATAWTLVDLEMDTATLVAALLHDVVEDQDVSMDEIKKRFGDEVASLVDGVTKLMSTDFDVGEFTEDSQHTKAETKKKKADHKRSAENLRKIFIAMASDFRVIVLKLADRLHNLNTLDSMPPDKRLRIARETMQIYAPLAHRLGIWRVKWELEDLAFKYLEPEAYESLAQKVSKTRTEREDYLAEAVEMLKYQLSKEGIEAHIMARPKHLWSIYQKMIKEGLDFGEIYDLSALRVVVNRVVDCYTTLGLVHDLWMPIPERFSDYIAKPKSNMYQSLHTKVIGPRGEPLEVQIRTWDMHRNSEFGIAAHWQYKENLQSGDEFERKLSFFRQQLFDWQSDAKDAGEFLSSVLNDMFTDQVFVFTPRGDVIDLPAGSTPIDFAYRIHSDVGNHCVGGKVNGRIVSLTYRFKNGDIVEIITRSNSQPSMDWLTFVKTSHARNRINAYFRKLNYGDNLIRGRESLEREFVRQGMDPSDSLHSSDFAAILRTMNYQNDEDLFAAIGGGSITVGSVVNKLRAAQSGREPMIIEASKGERTAKLTVTLDGVRNMMISRAKCCAPLPGEDVSGYVTRGKGVVMHADTCPNITVLRVQEPERIMPMDWKATPGEKYSADIKMKVLDRVGLLNEITSVISESKTNITRAVIKALPDKTADVDVTVEVGDKDELTTLLLKVESLSHVISVERVSARRDLRRTRSVVKKS